MPWKTILYPLLVAAAVLLLLGACKKTDATTSVSILAATGSDVVFSGTWMHCKDHSPNPDDGGTWAIVGSVMTASEYDYTSTGGACSAGQALRWTGTFTLTAMGDSLLNGWTDGTSLTTPPARLDGQGSLANPPSATLMSLYTETTNGGTGAPAVGSNPEVYLFMDNTATPDRVYQDDGNPSANCTVASGVTASGSCLITSNYLVQQ